MAPLIYDSVFPPVEIPHCSIFTHLFSASPNDPSLVGGYHGDNTAFIDAETGTSVSRKRLKELALSFGFGARNHPALNLRRGQAVVIYSPNSLLWPVVLFGCIAAGLKCTLANHAYTPDELAFQYTETSARVVCTTEEGLPTVRSMLKNLGLSQKEADSKIIVLGKSLRWAGGPDRPSSLDSKGLLRFENLLGLGQMTEEERFDDQAAHETAFLCFSSGTSGKPKGVMTSHRNVIGVTKMFPSALPVVDGPNHRLYGVLPFYHIYGAVKLVHWPFTKGVTVAISPKFNPDDFCAHVEKYKITGAFIAPPILVVLARHPAVEKFDLTSLAFLSSGAAPLGADLVQKVTERLKSVRGNKICVITQGYGLTETSPTTHYLPLEKYQSKIGSVGPLLPNLQARLVVDGEKDAERGQSGELWLRGPTIMKGYLNRPEATAEVIDSEGWFKTGDVAVIDSDGYYYIVDRVKELIKYKGFQVPPAELESILLTHPDIADAAVIGIYSEAEATELPRAYIVPTNPSAVNSAESAKQLSGGVAKWMQSKVARHKYLRGGVVVIDGIPKSGAGKILRRELRDQAKRELETQASKVKAKL